MEPYVCKNCGMSINTTRIVCEYCGTKYKSEVQLTPFYVECASSPVIRLSARCEIPMENLKYATDSNDVAKFAMNELTRQLAEGLAAAMNVETYNDYEQGTQIITAEVRCLKSDYRF